MLFLYFSWNITNTFCSIGCGVLSCRSRRRSYMFQGFFPHQFWPITACLCIKSSRLPKSELNLAGDHRAEEANNHNPAVCLLWRFKGEKMETRLSWLRCLGAAQETIRKTSQSEKFACYNSSDNVWTLKLLLAFIDVVPLKYPLHSPHNLAFRSTWALPSKHFDIWWADVSLSLYLWM